MTELENRIKNKKTAIEIITVKIEKAEDEKASMTDSEAIAWMDGEVAGFEFALSVIKGI